MPLTTQVVILGASGDLTARKLVPALHQVHRQTPSPGSIQLVGVARRPWDTAAFRAHLVERSGLSAGPERDRFLADVHYVATDLDAPADYRQLAERLDRLAGGPCHRVFYLAVKPDLFLPGIRGLHAAGLLRETDDLHRQVVIEKPFGHDLASAELLNRQLAALVDERQIFRIDHYLGKETVQNLLAFRFRNAFFEPLWNQKYIEVVQITVAEDLGMPGGRGGYYDRSGAVRDILQNHLLQLLALIAMEPPASLAADDIRNEKVKVLHSLRAMDALEDPARHLCRGQYAGYRDEDGVARDSTTETFIAVRAAIDNWRWGGVPFLLRTGKRLPQRFTSIRLQFRMPPHTLFGPPAACHLRPNHIHLRIQPEEAIDLHFDAKRPGPGLVMQPVRMHFDYQQAFDSPSAEAYQRLLQDVISGDQSLFIRSDEVIHSWRFTDSLRRSMAAVPLVSYAAGSWGPAEATALFGECEGRWCQG
jgi:glucose-6-phosphate 1-dehydrogenase